MKSKKTEVEAASDNATSEEEEEYAVERICGRRVRKGKVSVFIRKFLGCTYFFLHEYDFLD